MIMDYEKKYKESMAKMSAFLAKHDGFTISKDGEMYKELSEIFSELKESEDERIRKALHSFIKGQKTLSCFFGISKDQMLSWLEKQREQKSELLTKEKALNNSPFVEPKFNVGDWVVWDNKISCHVDNIFQGKNSLMYTITDTNNMVRSYSVKGFDNNAHLWTIKDAKEGDVLLSPSTPEGDKECPFIFEEIDKDGVVRYYIALLQSENIKVTDGVSNVMGYANAGYHTPATKEQRDLLFKKMKEKGYVWNEGWSPKVEQKHTPRHRVGDTIYYNSFGNLKSMIVTNVVDIGNGNPMYEDTDGNAVFEKDIMEQNPAWSEEDEKRMNHIIQFLEDKDRWKDNERAFPIEEDVRWLKSLKPQSTWKPSDDEMKALANALSLANNCGEEYAFDLRTLYKQLKKLREE